jgi:riboflavin kinase/FMN adenylyltransferase
MQIHRDLAHLPAFKNAILTIGTFDGVHTGHKQIISQLKAEAAAVDGESVIITFDPHPRTIIGSHTTDIKLINTLSEKIELLEASGINHLVIVPFNQAFASQPAYDYVEKFVVEKFHPHTIIIGYDHRFGNKREGNFMLLESLKSRFEFNLKEIPAHVLHNSNISSTKIRNEVLAGSITEANECLGYAYFFEGTVVEGNKLGRTIGYPTANLQVSDADKLVPGNGVYAVSCYLMPGENSADPVKANDFIANNPKLSGMMNIGIRPTIGGTKRVIEVNIFDFNQDIYGQNLRVCVHQRLRGEVKFNGLDELKAQLATDKKDALEVLKASNTS